MDTRQIFYESINYDKSNFTIMVFHQYNDRTNNYYIYSWDKEEINDYFNYEIFNYHKFENFIQMDPIYGKIFIQDKKNYKKYDKIFILGDLINDNEKKNIIKFLENDNCIFPNIDFFEFIKMYPQYIKDYDICQEDKNIDILKQKILSEKNSLFISVKSNISIFGINYFYNLNFEYLDGIENIYVLCTPENFEKIIKNLNQKNYDSYLKIKNRIQFLDCNLHHFIKKYPHFIANHKIQNNFQYEKYFEKQFETSDSIIKITNNIFVTDIEYQKKIIKERKYSSDYKNLERTIYNEDYLSNFRKDNIKTIINLCDKFSIIQKNDMEKLKEYNIEYCDFAFTEFLCSIETIKEQMFAAVEKIKDTIINGGNVIVNCATGLNRSPATIVLYLVKYENYSMLEAYNLFLFKRNIFTQHKLLNIIYEEAKSKYLNKEIPILKLRSKCDMRCNRTMDGLYDIYHLSFFS
jgi:protein-tyrosine phosphatase